MTSEGLEVTVDPVEATIQGTEQGVCFTVGVWVDMLRFALTYDTVLTTDDLSERQRWLERFVDAAPVPETFASGLFVDRIGETWNALGTHVVQTPFADLPLLVDKFAELTGLLAPEEALNSCPRQQEMKLLACVYSFYNTAILNNKMMLMVTVFKLGEVAPWGLAEQIAEDPQLPTEIIEQHAFDVPREIASRFAVHPNTPHRLRPLINVTLPHLPLRGEL